VSLVPNLDTSKCNLYGSAVVDSVSLSHLPPSPPLLVTPPPPHTHTHTNTHRL